MSKEKNDGSIAIEKARNLSMVSPTIVRTCLICSHNVVIEKGASESEPFNVGFTVCDECRNAVAWARKQMTRNEKIVHCKDCRFRNSKEERDTVPQWMPCREVRPIGDWYCAEGQRKVD